MSTLGDILDEAGRGNDAGEPPGFLQIARQLNTTIGSEFFQTLVKELAVALEADCVYVGEFIGGQFERVRTLAACVDRERLETLEFPLAGSPDAGMAIGNSCEYSSGVRELFPDDPLLVERGAEACVGIPLNDFHGRACGEIVALYRRPLGEEIQFAQAMLTMFAPRASAELVRKQADDALQESEQRYRAFIKMNTDPMWRLEFERPIATDLPEQEQLEQAFRYGYIAECNDAMAEYFGREKSEQLIGARISELSPFTEQRIRNSLGSFLSSGYKFSTVEVTPASAADVQRYTLRSQWGVVENGMLVRVWGMVRDITELKYYKVAFVNSERRLTELLEGVHLAVVILDCDGLLTFSNDYLMKLTGWRPEEVAGKNWLELMIPAAEREKVRTAFTTTLSSPDSPRHCEATLLTRDGRERLIEWDTVALRDLRGEICLAGVGRDVTESRALEARYRQAQRFESVGQLAGGVAHDFNNLLTVIRGYSALLMEDTKRTDPAYAGLVEISRAAEKGAALTRQLLAFSRWKVSEPRVLNLNAVVAENEKILRQLIGEHIELKTDLDPALGLVLADAGDIHQVLVNLAANALDAMPHGGRLVIALSNADIDVSGDVPSPRIEPGRYVRLVVSDSGPGMSDEVKSHLFEPFFTTKESEKGTGLGLSTIYRIVRQSGGDIQVKTELGKGTSFEILLPRVQDAAENQVEESAPNAQGGNETILLVEDQRELRTLLSSLLRRMGYTVIDAAGGRAALRLMRRASRPIHLLVTDIIMPGMLGSELASRVRAAHPETKVLYISGHGDMGVAQHPFHDSTAAYLEKSFTPQDLAAKIRETLG
jgi:two-component system cell cycle sensor histidine kinase/response regulator CckA